MPKRLLPRAALALLLLAGFFISALIEAIAIVPTIVGALAFLGLLVSLVIGAVTKRWGALKICALFFLTSSIANVAGFFTYLELRKGDAETAALLVQAVENYRRDQNHYPDELGALAPKYVAALPAPRFGQKVAPYHYVRRESEFALSYPTGFLASRTYESGTKSWRSND